MNTLSYAFGQPELGADFKLEVEDFHVVEQLGFQMSGEGEHVCVFVEKRGLNTLDVVKILSRHCNVSPRDISYAGLKDRQGITRQWFSLRVPIKRQLDFQEFNHGAITIIESVRNGRKIKKGSNTGNQFIIRLRNLAGGAATLEQRAAQIKQNGVPNYFGPQRFGRGGANVDRALEMFKGQTRVKDRFLRGIYLSAARSSLFNHYLSTRVEQDNWNHYLQGDVMALAGSESCFVPEAWDEVLQQRLIEFDIHPSGPLWGEGELKSLHQAKQLEQTLMIAYPDLCQGLVDFGLKQARRALRLFPQNLKIYSEGSSDVMVEFNLGKGAYATSVLRELVNVHGA